MKITIELELDEEPLKMRRCARCHSEEFRAITFQPFTNIDKGAWPNLWSHTFTSGNEQSQTTIALAICLNCNRICTLQ